MQSAESSRKMMKVVSVCEFVLYLYLLLVLALNGLNCDAVRIPAFLSTT